MRVIVLSKMEFNILMVNNNITDDNVEKRDSVMFISINDSNAHSHFDKNHDNVIALYFDDIDKEGEVSPINKGECKVFDDEMAENLYQFIKRNKDKETCVVHCEAGISRSGSVGLFVNDYTQSDSERFKRDNPYISPNQRVFRMLKNQWYNNLDSNSL